MPRGVPAKPRARKAKPKAIDVDSARTFKTIIEGLAKAEALVPIELANSVINEVVMTVNEGLDTLVNQLLLACNPSDKNHFVTVVEDVLNGFKTELSQKQIDVNKIAENMDLYHEIMMSVAEQPEEPED